MKQFVVKYKDKIVMFCCVVASVAPLFLLVHLWFTPNVEIKERNIARNCFLVEDYEMKELSRENTPLGIVKEYGFTISDELQHGAHLGFYISHHYAEVYIGEELVYSVMPSGRLKFIETIGCDWVLVPLLASDQGNQIRVILTPVYKSFMDWQPEFILGSSLDIYMKQLSQDAFCIICGLLSIVIGIVFSLQRGWRALKKKRDGYQPELGFFSVLLSLWVLTNMKSAPILLRWQPMLVYYISLSVLLIGALPVLRFMKKYLQHQIPGSIDLCSVLVSLVCVAQVILQAAGVLDLREMLSITHVLLGISILVLGCNVYYAQRKNPGSMAIKSQVWMSLVILMGVAADLMVFYIRGGSSNLNFSMLAFLIYILTTSVMLIREYEEKEFRVKEQEAELASNCLAMMMRQIQPHFIFNSLLTIRCLCKRDTTEAVDTIDHFSRFLRGSMDALTMHHGIPFENELNLVRDYLYMEKKRFGEKLKIRYVIAENDFLVPALSIQMIVENAVRHGIRQKLEGGTVSIETYRDGTDYMVRIKDDGVGFDPNAAKDDGRSHVGIENVQSRLALMCGGRLYINSVPGEGTEVILRIPDIQVEDAGE